MFAPTWAKLKAQEAQARIGRNVIKMSGWDVEREILIRFFCYCMFFFPKKKWLNIVKDLDIERQRVENYYAKGDMIGEFEMINVVLLWRTRVILTNWLTNLLRDRVGWISAASFQILFCQFLCSCSNPSSSMLIFIPLCTRFGCETFMKMFLLLYIPSRFQPPCIPEGTQWDAGRYCTIAHWQKSC